ncbi:IS3 family transposase [Paenibacillus sp. DYY-L-2]|uniref:IS3 family transposase n=1 Tax=Paenibacillus sp. DYY-L-2 TaxID=3447013 RepID=UPI003F4F8FC1
MLLFHECFCYVHYYNHHRYKWEQKNDSCTQYRNHFLSLSNRTFRVTKLGSMLKPLLFSIWAFCVRFVV